MSCVDVGGTVCHHLCVGRLVLLHAEGACEMNQRLCAAMRAFSKPAKWMVVLLWLAGYQLGLLPLCGL